MLLRQALSDERAAHGAALDVLPSTPTREQIERLEGHLLDAEANGAGVAIEPLHHFADGQVSRTILIPAGTILTGAAHKGAHLNVCCGDITVWTEAGMKRLTGYQVVPSLAGAKRVGFAHADTWWTSIHPNPTNTRDVAALERAMVETPEALQSNRLAGPSSHQEQLS
jgi:hypothetical protein